MANLQEIRSRITSIGSSMQITSAMKMVSAAKLKRAQDAIVQLRPYAEKLRELLQNISATLDADAGGALTQKREVKKVLLVALSSNRGLAGSFNSNVLKKTLDVIETDYKGIKVEVLTIGRKIHDGMKRSGVQVYSNHSDLWDHLNFQHAAEIADEVTTRFLEGDFDEVRLIYNQFVNAASQIVVNEQFLPLEMSDDSESNTTNLDYIFEPSKEEIVKDLIPQTLKTQFFKAVLDSNASEHGARMTAMHKATDNADALRKDLLLKYNKERQAAITNEILEIVGGAEALGA